MAPFSTEACRKMYVKSSEICRKSVNSEVSAGIFFFEDSREFVEISALNLVKTFDFRDSRITVVTLAFQL